VSIIDYPNGSTNATPLVLTDNSTQLQETAGTATQSGVISESGGSFGLEKIGAGTLVLTANETYTGTTTISDGTLQVGNGGAAGFIGGNIIDNGVLVSNTSSFTQFGGISGSGSLIKNGTGTLVLYSGNSFTGGTVVNSGLIFAWGLSALPGNITNNASIEFALNGDFAGGHTVTYSGVISGTGSVDFNGTGKLILASPQTYTGGTTLEFLTLQLSAGGSLPSTGAVILGGTLDLNGFNQTIGALSGFGAINLGSATLTTNSDTNTTTTAHITGSGGLTKGGTGTLTLSAFNGYTGVTTISGGAIALGTNGSDSGSLAGNVIDNAQLIFNLSDSYTFAGVISGTGQVSQTGAGKTTLTAANSYSGGTAISAGTLKVNADTGLGASSGSLTFNGGILQLGAAFNLSSARDISLGIGGGTIDTNGFDTAIGHVISGPGGLTKNGQGVLHLEGLTNTYSGGTTINGGTVSIDSDSNLGPGNLKFDGGILSVRLVNASPISHPITLNAAGGTIDNGFGTTISSSITGPGTLAKTGVGTLILTGANDYGNTVISGNGAIQVGNGGATGSLGAGSVDNNGSTVTYNLSVPTTINYAMSGTGQLVQVGGGALTITTPQSYTGGTSIQAGKALVLSGTGSLASAVGLNSNSTFDISGTTTPAGATIAGLGSPTPASGASVILGSKILTISNGSGSFGGDITGTGGLTISGGNQGLSGVNSYTGVTTIAVDATLTMYFTQQSVAASSDVIVNGTFGLNGIGASIRSLNGSGSVTGGVLTLTNAAGTFSGPIGDSNSLSALTVAGGTESLSGTITFSTFTISSGARVNLAGGANFTQTSNTLTVNGTLDVSAAAAGPTVQFLTGSGALLLGSNSLTLANPAGSGFTSTFSGVISGAGGVVIVGSTGGSGSNRIFSGVNTYSGATTIQNGGILQLAGGGSIANSEVSGAGTLQLGGSASIRSLAGSGAVSLGSGTLTLVNAAGTFSGSITGGGGLSLQAGTEVLAGNSSYTGATAVNAGTLSVTGSIANSSVTVANAATLGGTGMVGTTTIQNGGILAPGYGIGTLSLNGNLTLASGAIYAEELSPLAVDKALVNGSASLNGSLTTSFAAGAYTVGAQYTLLSATGSLNGQFNNIQVNGLSSNYSVSIGYGAHDVTLTIVLKPPVHAEADFNGDSKSDILWQNDNGQAALWLMNGFTQIGNDAVGGNPGPSWHIKGRGDFNGDGKADILWQNDNGQAALWLMNGLTQIGNDAVGPNPGPSWHVKGAGDFDGDGKADILWQNDNGQAALWLMNGLTQIGNNAVGGNPGPSWHIKGTGDFNSDGKADILWQNDNGQAALWLMNGFTQIGNDAVGANPGPSWHVQGVGDFDGDGKSDILWQNDNGQAAIWLMNGLTQIGSNAAGSNPGPAWHIKGAGDFDGDGKADILWQNDNGQAAAWLMSGFSQIGSNAVGANPGASWHLIAASS